MQFPTERIILKQNANKKSDNSLNYSFSSNNSFYEQLNDDIKKDIIFLIKSGYNKKTIIKLYILVRPSNVNEAIHYLSKENGKYQHIFYPSTKSLDVCEICGFNKNIHINKIDKSFNNSSFNSISFISKRIEIINVKSLSKINKICKICEEEILKNEVMDNECEECHNYICDECLYLNIKELIKNGNYELYCPECKSIYSMAKIERILSFNNNKNKTEVENLKKLLKKSNTKQIILSNPNLMFCPIVNCEGYSNKNSNNKNYNI